ncbi:DoxX family membrane protein [Gordonia sp. LSe1-13]|uniref:DoxX family membrane protein n=1 Tax=Gordonia sesuvii TaxID=3116777 RepID=A0ABU7MHU4_9ACTN|nr:DoxX family membrane protein [Gordonia sp. LSe1-13]
MSERDPAAGGGSSPYDEPTGEIDLGEAGAQRRRRIPTEERDTFYARHANPGPGGASRVDDLDDIEPDEVATRSMTADPNGPATPTPPQSPRTAPPEADPTPPTEAIDRRPPGAVEGREPAADDPTARFAVPAADAGTTPFAAADDRDPLPPTPTPTEAYLPPTEGYRASSEPYPATEAYAAVPSDDPVGYEQRDAPVGDERLRSVEEDLADAERRARRGTIDLGLLLLRCAVGVIAMAHGAQKLFGWWNGPRLSGFEDMLVNDANPAIGFAADAARPLAIVGALSETLGGLLLVIGLFTPLAASAVLGVMLVAAAYKATLAGGVWFFATGGGGPGIEYELLLAVCAAAIILTGPGRISIDAPRGWSRRPAWGSVAMLVVGIGAAVAVWLIFNGTNPFESPGNPTG